MTDDSVPQTPPRERQLPPGYALDERVLQKWIAIAPEQQVQIDALTRADFDNYLFSAGKTAKAIVALQTAFIAYNNGKLDEANSLMFDAHSAVIEGEVFARKFFEAIVKRAVKDMPDAKE